MEIFVIFFYQSGMLLQGGKMMGIKSVPILVFVYLAFAIAGRFFNSSEKKKALLATIIVRIALFVFALFATFIKDIPELASVFLNADLNYVSPPDLAVLIGIPLLLVDIVDSGFSWSDLKKEK